MPKYDGAEVKVFLAISRKTIGWHKLSDRISYAILQKMTGLSVNSLKKAIETLVTDKWITQESGEKGYTYDLNIENEGVSVIDTPSAEGYQLLTPPLSVIDTEGCQLLTPTLLKENKETKEKESSLSPSTDLFGKDLEMQERIHNIKHRWKVIALAYNLSQSTDINEQSIINCLADPLFDFDKIVAHIESSKKLRGLGKGNTKSNAVTFQSIITKDSFRQQIMDGVFDDDNQIIPVFFKDCKEYDFEVFKVRMAENETFKKKYANANLEHYYEAVNNWAKRGAKKSADWIEEAINFMRLDCQSDRGTGLKIAGATAQGKAKIREGYGEG